MIRKKAIERLIARGGKVLKPQCRLGKGSRRHEIGLENDAGESLGRHLCLDDNERNENPVLNDLLLSGRAIIHWAVYGELAVGHIKNRTSFLSDLKFLPFCEEASFQETMDLIERDSLFGKGLSLIDCILMASASKAGALIFSLDKKLNTFEE